MDVQQEVVSTQVLTSTSRNDTAVDDDITKGLLQPSQETGEICRFDGWPIRRVLGRGGMAIVLQGYDEKLSRDVAIKVLAPKLADNEVSRQRFAREARLTAKLRSDRVLTVYSVNDEYELPYIVMELIDGGTLREHLNSSGPLRDSELRKLSIDLAEGLDAAHQQGLLHRDLKPANIAYRTTDGRAVLMDFGLARVVCDENPITEQGFSPGTPAFMSPEQVKGLPLTRQSDLFSLGTVLYVAATGESPFRGANTSTTCAAVVKGELHDVASLRTDLPPDIAAIIRRLMAKDISERYASAAQVLADLTIKPPSTGSRWKRVATAVASLAFGALIAAGIILQIRRNDGSTQEVSLDGVERIVIVPTEGGVQVVTAKAETADLTEWRAQPKGREVVKSDGENGSVTITNPREEYDWVMVYSTAELSVKKPRYLHFEIEEVSGSDEAGWYVKMAPDGFGLEEIHLASGKETGRFVVAMPLSVVNSNQDRWAVQMFSTGPQNSQLRFRDISFVDEVPDGVDSVLAVP